MKIFFRALLVCVALSVSIAGAKGGGDTTDGWPLPWPFPWAKSCPMDWSQLDGMYILSDSHNTEKLILKINVLTRKGTRSVRVIRYSDNGRVLYEGSTIVTAKQKAIRLYLDSRVDLDSPRVRAVIKMHYQSFVASCAADHLIPILTVQGLSIDAPPAGIDYKMEKVQ